jgi:hypothetical protein
MSGGQFPRREHEMDDSTENPKKNTPDRFWFRIHNEVLHDMTFIHMSDADLGAYVRLLALANSTRNVGVIYADVAGIARGLRLAETATGELLERLERWDLIMRDDGMVAILDERHFEGKGLTASQSRAAQNERQRQRRDRLKQEAQAERGHSDKSQDIEEDSDSTEESQTEKRTYENRIEENRNTINEPSESEGPNQGDYLGGYLSHGGLDLEPHEEPLL